MANGVIFSVWKCVYLGLLKLVMNALNITNSFIPVATREEIIFLP